MKHLQLQDRKLLCTTNDFPVHDSVVDDNGLVMDDDEVNVTTGTVEKNHKYRCRCVA